MKRSLVPSPRHSANKHARTDVTMPPPESTTFEASEEKKKPRIVFQPRKAPVHEVQPLVVHIDGLVPSGKPQSLTLGVLSTRGHADVAKKIVAKARQRTTVELSADWDTKATTILVDAVRAITTWPPVKTAENVQVLSGYCGSVVSKGSSVSVELYGSVCRLFEQRSSEILHHLTATPFSDDDAWFLRVEEVWKRWSAQVLMTRSVLLQLDRSSVLHAHHLLPIVELGSEKFRQIVILDAAVSARLTASLMSLVDRDRRNASISRSTLRSVLTRLHSCSTKTYESLFVAPLRIATAAFYSGEADRLLGDQMFPLGGTSGYLAVVRRRLAEERSRGDAIVSSTASREAVQLECTRAVEVKMVGERATTILSRPLFGLAGLLDEFPTPTSTVDLGHLWSLFSRTGNVEWLIKSIGQWIEASGAELVKVDRGDEGMIERLLDFKTKVDGFIGRDGVLSLKPVETLNDKRSNDRDLNLLLETVKEAFIKFLNRRENKPAELIAKYLDAKLRIGSRGMGDHELEIALDNVMILFRYTYGKDVLEAFYKRDLGKRLLLGKSASAEAERSMLVRLKDECGPGFTVKLETMFKDMEVSADLNKLYGGTSISHSKMNDDSLDLSVSVLTTGNWPPYAISNINLPLEMSQVLERYTSFYMNQHSGRKLTWAHSLDWCTVKANFPKKGGGGTKELGVSLYQCVILLLFNEVPNGETLTFTEIVKQTGIESKEVVRTLQSLACGKFRVLVKKPKGKEVNEADEFAFNSSFKDDHFRIKINQIQSKETGEEQKITTERVFMDRSSHLQLAIVRILKSRKTARYSEIVMEVVGQIKDRFKVEPRQIKIAIESLIGREYLERVEGERDLYRYLA